MRKVQHLSFHSAAPLCSPGRKLTAGWCLGSAAFHLKVWMIKAKAGGDGSGSISYWGKWQMALPSALVLPSPGSLSYTHTHTHTHIHTHTGPCVIQPFCEVSKAGRGREVREMDIKRTQASRTAALDLAL